MATIEALQPRLRQLKLSGMVDSVAARVQEARARPLDPLDFLWLLLEDELTSGPLRRGARVHPAVRPNRSG